MGRIAPPVVGCLLLFLFLLGVNGLGEGFRLLGEDFVGSFFRATKNPFVGLMLGILATSMVQSSSVTTSLIVGLTAAPQNPLPLANAVPMVIGANFGTTVTNSIVALAHMGRKQAFRRAFAVSTCDDFFELVAVVVVLPVELATGVLQHSAVSLASWLTGLGGIEYRNPIQALLKAGFSPVRSAVEVLTDSNRLQGLWMIGLSFALILAGLLLLVRLLETSLRASASTAVSLAVERGAGTAMMVGAAVTVMIQSSSITTSLLVPLSSAGLLSLERAFPVVLGANLGTTTTALMAALAVTGVHAEAGLSIALVHVLYNVTGIGLIYPVRKLRSIPLAASQRLANIAASSPRRAFVYVLILFYAVPGAFALVGGVFD